MSIEVVTAPTPITGVAAARESWASALRTTPIPVSEVALLLMHIGI